MGLLVFWNLHWYFETIVFFNWYFETIVFFNWYFEKALLVFWYPSLVLWMCQLVFWYPSLVLWMCQLVFWSFCWYFDWGGKRLFFQLVFWNNSFFQLVFWNDYFFQLVFWKGIVGILISFIGIFWLNGISCIGTLIRSCLFVLIHCSQLKGGPQKFQNHPRLQGGYTGHEKTLSRFLFFWPFLAETKQDWELLGHIHC